MPRLPKEHILRGYKAFSRILTDGKVITCGSVKLFYLPVDPSRPPQVGFSVSRSIRNAAARNRIRRCLREAYRLNQQQFRLPVAMDYVLLYSGPPVRKTGEIDCVKLSADVVEGFRRLAERVMKR